jgi:urea transporter
VGANTASSEDDREDDEHVWSSPVGIPPFVEQTLRGMGQVVFANSMASGALVVGALAAADVGLAALSVAGCAASTAVANTSPSFESTAVNDGIYGYNGALVGCAFGVFLPGAAALNPLAALLTVGGGAVSALATREIGQRLRAVPQFTLAFNVVALAALVPFRPLAAPADAALSLKATAAPSSMTPLLDSGWLEPLLAGVSQIFVVADSPACGALVLCALAAQGSASTGARAVVHALMGSYLGVATGLALGVDAAGVAAGLCGFNPALTALAIATFVQPSPRTIALAAGGAVLTAAATAAAVPLFGALALPTCTLPFCAVASGCLLAAPSIGCKVVKL